MRKFTIICMMVSGAFSSFTQTPVSNLGFEDWTDDHHPTNWLVRGATASKSTDKFDGNNALLLQTTITTLNHDGDGVITSLPPNGTEGAQPAFPISARYTTLNGYYKFSPLNGDSCQFWVMLYKHGYVGSPDPKFPLIGYGSLCKSASTTYTPFTVSIRYFDSYIIPDSAWISLSSYKDYNFLTMTNGSPKGNSTLYVDKLSFDGLNTSISENIMNNSLFNLYPNPASDIITLKMNNTDNEELVLSIYNIAGALVKSEKLNQNRREINIRDLSNGIYMVEIKSNESTEKQKLIIQK